MFKEQGRPNFVAATTTIKFEQMVTVFRVLDSLYVLTLDATSPHASIASHTRAATTLRNDAEEVGSVTVKPRATHATEKCIVGRRDTTTTTVNNKFVRNQRF